MTEAVHWIFASPNLTFLSCEPVGTEEAWSLSDHCPLVGNFDVNVFSTRSGKRALD